MLVKVNDRKFLNSDYIASVETIRETNCIRTVVTLTNDEEYEAFRGELNNAKMGDAVLKDLNTVITAVCYKEIITAECNYEDNISGTFRNWIEEYINDIDLGSSPYIKDFDKELGHFISDAIERCDDDLYDTLDN